MEELEDGSRIAPEDEAMSALRRMLTSDGRDETYIEDALKRYDEAKYDSLVELPRAIAVK